MLEDAGCLPHVNSHLGGPGIVAPGLPALVVERAPRGAPWVHSVVPGAGPGDGGGSAAGPLPSCFLGGRRGLGLGLPGHEMAGVSQ